MLDQDLRLDPTQVEPLAPAQDRHRHLADLGGGEDEFGVGRRLLQRLQQGVERLRRQHVDLVQHIDLVARLDGRIADALQDVADVVDAGVRRRVHLHHVHVLASHDGRVVPPVGGQGQRRLVDAVGFVVQGAGQQTRGRRLADPPHPGQHEGVGDPAGGEGIGQGPDHRLLPDQILEGARPIFARQHLIGGAVVDVGRDFGRSRLGRDRRNNGRRDRLRRRSGRAEHVVGVLVALHDLVLFPGRAVHIGVAVRHGDSLSARTQSREAIPSPGSHVLMRPR